MNLVEAIAQILKLEGVQNIMCYPRHALIACFESHPELAAARAAMDALAPDANEAA